MMKDCYDGYRCIINQNIIILVNADSLGAPRTLGFARATEEDSTQLDR